MSEGPTLNEFAPVSIEVWRQLVDRDLKGADFDRRLVKQVAEGVVAKPLYTLSDACADDSELPGEGSCVRGSHASVHRVRVGWGIQASPSQAEPAAPGAALQDELAGGVTSLCVQLHGSVGGTQDDAGVRVEDLAAFEHLLAGVSLGEVPLHLDAGAYPLPAAAMLLALAERRGIPTSELSGSLGADPVGALLTRGQLPCAAEHVFTELVCLAKYCASALPQVRAACVNTAAVQEAGADAVVELATAAATGIAYLRAMLDGGMEVNQAAGQIAFQLRVGRDFFMEIAKLRAARKLWSRVVDVAGGTGEARAMQLHASTTLRTKTQRDPWVNLLRSTSESFAAAMGGADTIRTTPFDAALGPSDAFASRLARNTQLILQRESHLHRVVDPAGGSWYIERLTEELAQAAWQRVQAIEAEGGILAAVRSGNLQQEVRRCAERDALRIATRKLGIVGVSEYAQVEELPLERPSSSPTATAQATQSSEPGALKAALERLSAAQAATRQRASLQPDLGERELVEACIGAASAGAGISQLAACLEQGASVSVQVLSPAPYAAAFESLRARSDVLLAQRGRRPRAFLVNLGPIPVHQARAGFATNFFSAGGFEVLRNDGFAEPAAAAEAFAASDADVVCVCSSDEVYAELAQSAGEQLLLHDPRALLLAGKPEDEAGLRAAGYSDFIFLGCDAVRLLDTLLTRVEHSGAERTEDPA